MSQKPGFYCRRAHVVKRLVDLRPHDFSVQRRPRNLSVTLWIPILAVQFISLSWFASCPQCFGQNHFNDFSTAPQPATHHTSIPEQWPQQTVTFESQIQSNHRPVSVAHDTPASGEFRDPSVPQTDTNTQPQTASLESWIEQVGPTLTKVKTTIEEKAGGLLGSASDSGASPNFDVGRMLSSLALVVGCYLGFVWFMRKLSPSGNRQLPVEVVQILGRLPFGAKQHLQLIRLGSKLVLLLNGPDGTQPVGEVTNPHEVEQLIAFCGNKQRLQRPIASLPPTPAPTIAAPAPPAETTHSGLAGVLRSLENSNRNSRYRSFEA